MDDMFALKAFSCVWTGAAGHFVDYDCVQVARGSNNLDRLLGVFGRSGLLPLKDTKSVH